MSPLRLAVAAVCVATLLGCPPSGAGAQGEPGPQGPRGETGPAGAPGANGRDGVNGVDGAAGAQGPQGPTGPQGPMGQVLILDGGVVTGPRGPMGTSVVVTPLAPGAACPAGGVRVAQEDGGNPQQVCNGQAGAAGQAGASVVLTALGQGDATCPSGGTRLTVGNTTTFACNGAAGAPGATGTPGTPGAPGAMGPQGPVGPPGPALLLDGGSFPVSASDGFVFAGFTAMTFTGNLGGPVGANAKCNAELPGAHLCTMREYQWTGSPLTIPASGAWIDDSSTTSSNSPNNFPRDRVPGSFCDSWRSEAGPSNWATYLDATGVWAQANYNQCQTPRPLACCRSPHAGWFRGFTALTFDGNLGGPVGANAKCHAQYAGAHLCTMREYSWAGSPSAVPVGGAWIDDSSSTSSNSPNNFPRDRVPGSFCNSWRSNVGPSNWATYLDVSGVWAQANYNQCQTPRALACCGG